MEEDRLALGGLTGMMAAVWSWGARRNGRQLDKDSRFVALTRPMVGWEAAKICKDKFGLVSK